MLKLFLMSVARKDSDSSLLKTRQKLKLPNRNSMDQLLKVRTDPHQGSTDDPIRFEGRSNAFILGRKVEVNDATVRVQSKKSNHNLCTGLTGLPPGHQMNKQGKNKLIIPQNINIMVR